MQVEEGIRDPLLLSSHPSAKDTYQALEGVLKEQLACSTCIEKARGILQTMLGHRKRLGELQQQYGRILPETDINGAPLVAESGNVQSATALEQLPVDVVGELMNRESDLTRATVLMFEGALRRAGRDIWRLRGKLHWVSVDWPKGPFWTRAELVDVLTYARITQRGERSSRVSRAYRQA